MLWINIRQNKDEDTDFKHFLSIKPKTSAANVAALISLYKSFVNPQLFFQRFRVSISLYFFKINGLNF